MRILVLILLGLLRKPSWISLTVPTLKIPGKLVENTQKNQGNPQQEDHQGNKKHQGKK